jgi:hypothetical protein
MARSDTGLSASRAPREAASRASEVTVAIGLYDAATGKRLSIEGSDGDRFLLGKVKIIGR